MSTLLVLASASPRRIDMLRRAEVPHAVLPVDIDETPAAGESAESLVERLSRAKADAAALRADENAPILAADTMVVATPQTHPTLLGKPPHEGAARQMLLLLSGATHHVLTGYHLRYFDPVQGTLCRRSRTVATEVDVRTLLGDELSGYLRSEEWRGKAGAYALQGRFSCFVTAIRGSYENVVGLPLCSVLQDLRSAELLPKDWPVWSQK
jgi:septum formation protein